VQDKKKYEAIKEKRKIFNLKRTLTIYFPLNVRITLLNLKLPRLL
jgi:hypothetical protein